MTVRPSPGARERTGGELLAAQLAREGIRQIFGIPGVQLDHAVDGLARNGQIALWNTRHEQAAGYMAFGYARSSRDVGTFMVVPGPGLLNAASALATSYACSARVLAICGQLPLGAIGAGLGLLHDIPDQSRHLAGLTKWSALARSADDLPALVRRAVRELRSGRPRPAGLEIPPDVLAAKTTAAVIDPPSDDTGLLAPEPDLVDKAAAILRAARTPLIYAGGGAITAAASAELAALAELLEAPVVMSVNGRGALPDRHPLACGPLTVAELLPAADVVLAIGSRFLGFRGQPLPTRPGATTISVNADAADLGEPRVPDIAVHADARLTLQAIAAELAGARPASQWGTALRQARQKCAERLAPLEPQMSYVSALRDAIPDDGILVSEFTQVGYVTDLAYPVREPYTYIRPGYQGTLGFGFPTALGAKVGRPGSPVVSITGDGGFGFNLAELATARQYNIGVIVVVFVNDAYGNVLRTQQEKFAGRVLGAELTNPDFVALARAFDIGAARAGSPAELNGILAEAIGERAPFLIEVPIRDGPTPWPLLVPMRPREERQDG
jgi:acetolactate synthase I/II/III large subunit